MHQVKLTVNNMGKEGKEKSALDEQVGGDHYKKLGIQPIELIRDINANFFQGNVIKYITRYKYKNGIKDLEKAKHYLELIEELHPDNNNSKIASYEIDRVNEYIVANKIDINAAKIIIIVSLCGNDKIDKAIELINNLINDYNKVEECCELGIIDTATTLFGNRNNMVAKEDLINGTTVLKPLILPEGCSLDAFKEVARNMEHPYDLVGDEDVNKLKE